MIGIYCFTNKINNKKYVGQSRSIETRKNAHLNCSQNPNYNGFDTKFYRALRKYGFDNFKFEVLEECGAKDLNYKEQYYINQLDSFKNGYNSSIGGEVVANGYGEDHSQAILSEADVLAIKNGLNQTNLTEYEIANIFGITQSEISMINNGVRWSFLGNYSYPIRNGGQLRMGEKNHASILTDKEVMEIRQRYISETGKQIYQDYQTKLSYTSFERALTGRTFRHLPIYKKKSKTWTNPVSTILG